VRKGDQIVIQAAAIQQLCNRIVQEFQPERVILFGSHAYGMPREDSDVDLMVILPFEGNGLQKAAEILRRVQPPFAIDLLARTPEQIEQRLAWNDFFLREIIEKGKVLYAASDR
jgi:predicted nucleotidyltransferase